MSTELKNITKNVKDIKSVVKCLKNVFKSQKNEILLSTQQNEKRYIDMNESIAKELKSIREATQHSTYASVVSNNSKSDTKYLNISRDQYLQNKQNVIICRPIDKNIDNITTHR
jgi:hypothetical protein